MHRILGLLALICWGALAQDQALETRTSEEMAQRKPDSTVWLDAGTRKFAALLLPSVPKAKRGGLVLIHGTDEPPDARDLLGPLSQKLPERGWEILSIQAALPEQASSPEQHLALTAAELERVEAAVKYLQERKAGPVALLGVDTGALAVMKFAAEKSETKLAAIVVIDPPAVAPVEPALLGDLAKIKIPVLDIQSNRSKTLTPEVLRSRKRAAQENPGYRQTSLIDASTGYAELQDMLTNRIGGWLSKETPERQVNDASAKTPTPSP